MALSRDKKEQVVADIKTLLADSKLTVISTYQGTPVKDMQVLRHDAAPDGTTIRVVKNRLFKKALGANTVLKDVDTSQLHGQLLYAFNSEDEVAPARSIADFAKTNPGVQFVAAISSEGQLLSPEAVKELASLPAKDALRAQLIGTISAPLNGFLNVAVGNVRGVLNVLNARAESMAKQ